MEGVIICIRARARVRATRCELPSQRIRYVFVHASELGDGIATGTAIQAQRESKGGRAERGNPFGRATESECTLSTSNPGCSHVSPPAPHVLVISRAQATNLCLFHLLGAENNSALATTRQHAEQKTGGTSTHWMRRRRSTAAGDTRLDTSECRPTAARQPQRRPAPGRLVVGGRVYSRSASLSLHLSLIDCRALLGLVVRGAGLLAEVHLGRLQTF